MLLVLNENFGAKLLPGTAGGLMLSFDNPLNFHAMSVWVTQVGFVS